MSYQAIELWYLNQIKGVWHSWGRAGGICFKWCAITTKGKKIGIKGRQQGRSN